MPKFHFQLYIHLIFLICVSFLWYQGTGRIIRLSWSKTSFICPCTESAKYVRPWTSARSEQMQNAQRRFPCYCTDIKPFPRSVMNPVVCIVVTETSTHNSCKIWRTLTTAPVAVKHYVDKSDMYFLDNPCPLKSERSNDILLLDGWNRYVVSTSLDERFHRVLLTATRRIYLCLSFPSLLIFLSL